MIEMSMSKMVATNVLEPDFNSGDFWKAFARKFTSAQSYDVKKRKAEKEPVKNIWIYKYTEFNYLRYFYLSNLYVIKYYNFYLGGPRQVSRTWAP